MGNFLVVMLKGFVGVSEGILCFFGNYPERKFREKIFHAKEFLCSTVKTHALIPRGVAKNIWGCLGKFPG